MTASSKLQNANTVAKVVGCDPNVVRIALPKIIKALGDQGILSDDVLIGVIATVVTECSFKPIEEIGNDAYFSKYDGRKDLGNIHPGDGLRFKGRGFIQLTGRHNYEYYGRALGFDLVGHPELALQYGVGSEVLALYFKERHIDKLCEKHEWQLVRKAVNGGLNGYDRFIKCVNALLVLEK